MNNKTICPYHPEVAGDGFISEEWGETRICYFIKDHFGAVEESENRYCKNPNYAACGIFMRKKATEEGKREEFTKDVINHGMCSDADGVFMHDGPSDGIC